MFFFSWQLFPTLYFCPFFLMISKYRKIFLITFIITLFFAWFSFCPVGYFTYLCIFNPLLFYIIYTLKSVHIIFQSQKKEGGGNRNTPEHDLHRSQGRNRSGGSQSFSKEKWEDSVHPVISIASQTCTHDVLRNQLWQQILTGNWVPLDELYMFPKLNGQKQFQFL